MSAWFFFFFKLFLSIYSPCTLKFPSKVDPKNLGDLKKKELHPIYSSNPKETKGYVKNNFYFFYYNNIIMQNIDRVNPMDHEELYGSWRTFRTFHNFFLKKNINLEPFCISTPSDFTWFPSSHAFLSLTMSWFQLLLFPIHLISMPLIFL